MISMVGVGRVARGEAAGYVVPGTVAAVARVGVRWCHSITLKTWVTCRCTLGFHRADTWSKVHTCMFKYDSV